MIYLIAFIMAFTIVCCAISLFNEKLYPTLGFCVIWMLLFIYLVILSEMPTPMDVYQGNTTLEVTYKDGVPVDSNVVFKDNVR